VPWNKWQRGGVYVSANACLHPSTQELTMKFSSRIAISAALSFVLLGGCASMVPAPATVADGVLVGPNGMTLYTFDKDVAGSGKSVCNGPCATNWPPLMAVDADKATGDFTVITRDDGKKQWAVKGKPVYFWIKDAKPGDKTGDGVNKVWQVAKP
jgi:predicted lipoprotein with Yx(FWY)xxD motif